jgi:prepilin-type processing-associated H-X9-DG protein
MSEIKSDTIILMEGMQSRVGFSWWSALETHNNQNMLDIQDFDQHKNGKMNFLFNDGSAAAKNNLGPKNHPFRDPRCKASKEWFQN